MLDTKQESKKIAKAVLKEKFYVLRKDKLKYYGEIQALDIFLRAGKNIVRSKLENELQGIGLAVFSFPRAFDTDTIKKLKNESAESEVKTVIPIIIRVLISLLCLYQM